MRTRTAWLCLLVAAAACECGDGPLSVSTTGVDLVQPKASGDLYERVLDLGPVRVGTPGTQAFVLHNNAANSARITRFEVSSATTEFTLSPEERTIVLEAKGDATFTLTYQPVDEGADAAVVVIATDLNDAVFTVHVSGSGVKSRLDACTSTTPPTCSLNTANHELPIALGRTTPGSAVRSTLVVYDRGGAPVTIQGFERGEGTSTEFSATPVPPVTVAAGGEASFEIVFEPTVGGPRAGTLVLVSDDPESPRVVLNLTAHGGPVDECALGTGTCPAHATCHDLEEGWNCPCEAGWVAEGEACVNVDECAGTPGPCTVFETCHDLDGSWECLPVDECALATATCPANSVCVDVSQGWECHCIEGFEAKDGACANVDECALTPVPCPTTRRCHDLPGSFECQPIDECALGTATCPAHATCRDLLDGFECPCDAGWAAVGAVCEDVDECATPSRCATAQACHNLPGSFECLSPAIEATASVTFPATRIGQTSAPSTVTVRNTGLASLSVGTPTIQGDFAITTNGCTSAIAPAGTCTIGLTFTPTASGQRTGTLTIPSNASATATVVTLAGTGTVPTFAGHIAEPNVVVESAGSLNWVARWRFDVTVSGAAQTVTIDGVFTATCPTSCQPPIGSYGYYATRPGGALERISRTINGYPTDVHLTKTYPLEVGTWKVQLDFLTIRFDVTTDGKLAVVSYVDTGRSDQDRTSFLTVTNPPE